jgi:hypothetical protein
MSEKTQEDIALEKYVTWLISKDDKEKVDWIDSLTEREADELNFAIMYDTQFKHGTDGHHRLLLIAKLSRFLDYLWSVSTPDHRKEFGKSYEKTLERKS